MKFGTQALSLWRFIKILRVEPFLFLMAFQQGLQGTPYSQMILDKICEQWYNTSSVGHNYCLDLPSLDEKDDHAHLKSLILADASEFATYSAYVQTPTGIIWALFIGSWVDRYVPARKIILLVFSFARIVESLIAIYVSISWNSSVYYNLLIRMPAAVLIGGEAGSRIAIMHYITTTTPPKLMAIRFMLFQICITLALPVGQSLGGYILVQKPTFHTGELRNYTVVFIIAFAVEFMALLWTVIMVNERVAQKQQLKIKIKEMDGVSNEKITKAVINVHPLRLLFDIGNVKLMIKTIIKKRPNKARKQIIWLMLSLSILTGEYTGLNTLSNQFIQRVYNWSPDWIAYMSSVWLVISSACTLAIVPIASKVFKVTDIPLALYGYVINLFVNLIKGCWLSENAHYLSMAIGAIGVTTIICTNAHISKIVGKDEMGKLMSFMTMLNVIAPTVSTTIFAYIFKYTVDTYPGAVYQVMTALALIPVFVMIWIDLYTERPLSDGEESPQRKTDEIESKIENVLDENKSLNKLTTSELSTTSEVTKL